MAISTKAIGPYTRTEIVLGAAERTWVQGVEQQPLAFMPLVAGSTSFEFASTPGVLNGFAAPAGGVVYPFVLGKKLAGGVDIAAFFGTGCGARTSRAGPYAGGENLAALTARVFNQNTERLPDAVIADATGNFVGQLIDDSADVTIPMNAGTVYPFRVREVDVTSAIPLTFLFTTSRLG